MSHTKWNLLAWCLWGVGVGCRGGEGALWTALRFSGEGIHLTEWPSFGLSSSIFFPELLVPYPHHSPLGLALAEPPLFVSAQGFPVELVESLGLWAPAPRSSQIGNTDPPKLLPTSRRRGCGGWRLGPTDVPPAFIPFV